MTETGSYPSVIIMMGVSGSGKTTVGRALAARIGWKFIEGDDYHSAENIAAMTSDRPLQETDRVQWLLALRERIDELLASSERAVFACSALRHSYRSILTEGTPPDSVRFVHLVAPPEVLRTRLMSRVGHYMPAALLVSQLETLEESTTALRVDGTMSVPWVVEAVVRALVLSDALPE